MLLRALPGLGVFFVDMLRELPVRVTDEEMLPHPRKR